MTIVVYSFKMSPFCRAVLMTARELNIDLDVKEINPIKGEQFDPEFVKLNPKHTIPTINDNGFILWESRAIMQYLCNQYAPDSGLYPKDSKKRALVDRWLNFDIALMKSVMNGFLTKMYLGIEPDPMNVKSFNDNLKLLNTLIGDNKYLTGNCLTIADLTVLASTCFLLAINYDMSEMPNTKRWLMDLKEELPYFDEILVVSKEEMEATLVDSKEYLNKKFHE